MSGEAAERPEPPGRAAATAYAAATLGLTAAGIGTAAVAGGPTGAIAAGALGAWAVQAVSFWRLVAAVAARRDAVRAWVSGIAARLAGLVVAGIAAAVAPADVALPLAYGAALVVFLLVEAAWLSRRPWPGPTRNREREDERPDDSGDT